MALGATDSFGLLQDDLSGGRWRRRGEGSLNPALDASVVVSYLLIEPSASRIEEETTERKTVNKMLRSNQQRGTPPVAFAAAGYHRCSLSCLPRFMRGIVHFYCARVC